LTLLGVFLLHCNIMAPVGVEPTNMAPKANVLPIRLQGFKDRHKLDDSDYCSRHC
jgi:hypothetical protein